MKQSVVNSSRGPTVRWSDVGRPHLLSLAILLAAAGCDSAKYHRKADEEVYRLIRQKQQTAMNEAAGFTVDRPRDTLRARLLGAQGEARESPSETGRMTRTTLGPAVAPELALSLRDALEAAAENSREYQTEREDVYLAALDLTLERHQFSNRFTALLSGRLAQDRKDVASAEIGGEGSVSRRLASGGQVVASLGVAAARALAGGTASEVLSTLDIEIVQPLLRGAGRKVALEGLVQAERNAIYAVQSFARFQKTFAVGVISDYYSVLELREIVENEGKNSQNLRASRERAEALYQAGRMPEIQVGQTRQNELRARNRWINAQQQYQTALDRFKITLGLPTDVSAELDARELNRIREAGLAGLIPDVESAIWKALDARLDLLVVRGREEDAERKVRVAADGLRADLNLTLTSGVESDRPNHFTELRFDRGRYAGGFDLGLPLDRKAERNLYREAEINFERSRRAVDQTEDQVKFEVRQAVRQLARARDSYGIQQTALEEARRRVEGANLLLEAGRAQTRDLLEAQDALVDAQNGVTRALVDYEIARLEFLRDTEELDLDAPAMGLE